MGPTFNNRWWNDRREWNLRIAATHSLTVPKGGEQKQKNLQPCFSYWSNEID